MLRLVRSHERGCLPLATHWGLPHPAGVISKHRTARAATNTSNPFLFLNTCPGTARLCHSSRHPHPPHSTPTAPSSSVTSTHISSPPTPPQVQHSVPTPILAQQLNEVTTEPTTTATASGTQETVAITGEEATGLSPQKKEFLDKIEAFLRRLASFNHDYERPSSLPWDVILAETADDLERFFRVVIAGEFNAGKSSLINTLIEATILKEDVWVTTSQIASVRWGEIPSETTDASGILVIHHPAAWLRDNKLELLDTPGVHSVVQGHQEITEKYIPKADLILFVLSADRLFSASEKDFLASIASWGKKVAFVLNKIDTLRGSEEQVQHNIKRLVSTLSDQAKSILPGSHPLIFPISAYLAKEAQSASSKGDKEKAEQLMQRSKFSSLQSFIREKLGEDERFFHKVKGSLGIAAKFYAENKSAYDAELSRNKTHVTVLGHLKQNVQQFEERIAVDLQSTYEKTLLKQLDEIQHNIKTYFGRKPSRKLLSKKLNQPALLSLSPLPFSSSSSSVDFSLFEEELSRHVLRTHDFVNTVNDTWAHSEEQLNRALINEWQRVLRKIQDINQEAAADVDEELALHEDNRNRTARFAAGLDDVAPGGADSQEDGAMVVDRQASQAVMRQVIASYAGGPHQEQDAQPVAMASTVALQRTRHSLQRTLTQTKNWITASTMMGATLALFAETPAEFIAVGNGTVLLGMASYLLWRSRWENLAYKLLVWQNGVRDKCEESYRDFFLGELGRSVRELGRRIEQQESRLKEERNAIDQQSLQLEQLGSEMRSLDQELLAFATEYKKSEGSVAHSKGGIQHKPKDTIMAEQDKVKQQQNQDEGVYETDKSK
ncbi:tRNA U34 5-carboxymethylaminomethyl modifying GTPase MnmE/TrmE [Balamuthia mandrillaris]